MKIIKKIINKLRSQSAIPNRLDIIQEALGRIESRLNLNRQAANIQEHEFKVYSQWGEDGIIDHIVNMIHIPNKIFVEFGVENYTEANTLFLLKHRQWSGLVIDGSDVHINSIKNGHIFWRYNLVADCSFITKDNINDIIKKNNILDDIGLLSVDIDGNDYWVWEAITCISPRIVVAEYNSLFGPIAKISIPYKADFYRTNEHASNMYYGASISALTHLAHIKGYSLVAGNSAGNNVFFIRNDCLGRLSAINVSQAYTKAAFREARTQGGDVELLTFLDRQVAISHLPLIDVVTGETQTLGRYL